MWISQFAFTNLIINKLRMLKSLLQSVRSGFPVLGWSALGGIFLFLFIFSFSTSGALAQTGYNANTGSSNATTWGGANVASDFQNRTALGNEDPRSIVANIINISLGFLGIIAIFIIMYAGFLWMMSGGNPDKINKAKKTLISGFIGLVIVLSSFAIASFVLDTIFRATTSGGGNNNSNVLPGPGGGSGGGTGGGGGNGTWQLTCSSATDGTCTQDESMCDSLGEAWSCNNNCQCVVSNMGSCFNEIEDACTSPCRAGLSCFGHDPNPNGPLCDDNGNNPPAPSCGDGNGSCYCCCSPTDDHCGEIYPTLSCLADQGACDGGDRGLCCGCTADNECDSNGTGVTGCADDTCCHNRPLFQNTVPIDRATDVCTNPLISVRFDQPMKSASLANNLLVVGVYNNSHCPANTSLLDVSDPAIPLSPTPGVNYCSVNGSTRVRNTGTEHYIDFVPSNFLEVSTNYHIIIRGDLDLSDNSNDGIQNYWGLSMSGSEMTTFTTIDDPSPSAGVCMIESVSLTPTSYLFRTTQNSAREVDTDAASDKFDVDRDVDKVFYANAISSSHQVIAPMTGYNWDWVWGNTTSAVVGLAETLPGLTGDDLADGSAFVYVAGSGVTDGRSIISAKVDMSQYLPVADGGDGTNTINDGNNSQDTSPVYVFICDNPWPPVRDDGSWKPWEPNPNDYNYDIYYCRDKLPKGTIDDLPAFDSAGVANNTNLADVLQQVYFSYQDPPPPGHIIEARTTSDTAISPPYPPSEDIDYPDGGAVYLRWSTVGNDWSGPNPPEGKRIGGYKIYWGDRSGHYTNNLDVEGQNTSSVYIEGLTNEKKYYFSITAYTNDQSESSYYDEKIVIPHDTVAPTTVPVILEDEITVSETEIEIYWKEVEGAYGYQVAYGLDDSVSGAVIDVGRYTGAVIESLTPGVTYYFAVRIVDEAGNEGLYYSTIVSTTTLQHL